MATSKQRGVQSFEARFPIVATNLRALVSSWLPAAREPSPVDEENGVNEETQGRQEGYSRLIGIVSLTIRLALGATLSVSMPNTTFQNRMNRKLGIGTNGIVKSDNQKSKRSDSTSQTKRQQANEESESEEDSKAKLITKKAKKLGVQVEKQDKTNPALSRARKESPSTVRDAKNRALIVTTSITTTEFQSAGINDSKLDDPAILDVNAKLNGTFSPSGSPKQSKPMDIPNRTDLSPESESSKQIKNEQTTEMTEQERKRLKKERKKERKRLKKQKERQQRAEAAKAIG
jgi:hypothetical protein